MVGRAKVKSVHEILERFEATPECRGFDLRLDLADIIIRHLNEHGWTQKRLAEATGMKEANISRIINAEVNCTFRTAGRILHALGVRADLVEMRERTHT